MKYIKNENKKSIIKENARMRLKEACFNKPLFRNELKKVVKSTSRHDLFIVLKYCYHKYYEMHADVLLEVYNDCIETISNESPVKL